MGGPGLVAALLVPAPAGLAATLFLDDAAERPFATYLACLERLPRLDQGGPASYGVLERKRAWTEAPRRPGDEDRLEATLYPLGPGVPVPLLVERWPRGARAAVVFTDHADRTDPAALRAVLFGHSDPRAEGSRGAGLLGRGLAITRSFFVWPGPGTLADPETWRLASWLVGAGSEVALHSISDGRDDREAIRAGLEAAAPLRPETWIDHQPYVNCEALSAQGAQERSPWEARGLLAEGGIRWAWAAGDVAGFRSVEVRDLFGAAPPGAPSPAIYPLPGEPRLWVFQSSFFYAPPAELARALSDEALDRLERGDGLFVAHTYLGAGPATTGPGPGGGAAPGPAAGRGRAGDRPRARRGAGPAGVAGGRREAGLAALDRGGRPAAGARRRRGALPRRRRAPRWSTTATWPSAASPSRSRRRGSSSGSTACRPRRARTSPASAGSGSISRPGGGGWSGPRARLAPVPFLPPVPPSSR